MKEAPKTRDEKIMTKEMVSQILFMGTYTILLCTAFLKLDFFKNMFHYADSKPYFLTVFFALFIFTGIFNSFNARTEKLNLFSNLIKNPSFIVILGCICLVQIFLIYFGGHLFRTTGLIPVDLRTVLLISATVIPVDLVRKIIRKIQRN